MKKITKIFTERHKRKRDKLKDRIASRLPKAIKISTQFICKLNAIAFKIHWDICKLTKES